MLWRHIKPFARFASRSSRVAIALKDATRQYRLLAGAAGTGSLVSLLGVQLKDDSKNKPKSPFTRSSGPPVQVHDVKSATELLKQHSGRQYFASGKGRKGSFDYIRFASNSPIEDEMDAETGQENAPWLCWGVYDGHACE